MTFGGIMAIFQGIAAIVQDDVFVATRNFTYEFSLTGWGWIHLILGALVAAAGLALFAGAAWARMVGIALAGLSMVANFVWLPHAPAWSIVLLVIDGFIIWALCAPRREFRPRTRVQGLERPVALAGPGGGRGGDGHRVLPPAPGPPGAEPAPGLAPALIALLLLRQVAHVLLGRPDVRPRLVVPLLMSLSVLVFATAYQALSQCPGELDGIATRLDALYLTLITLATVGYGDIPRTVRRPAW